MPNFALPLRPAQSVRGFLNRNPLSMGLVWSASSQEGQQHGHGVHGSKTGCICDTVPRRTGQDDSESSELMADSSGSKVCINRKRTVAKMPKVGIELISGRPALPPMDCFGDLPTPRSGHLLASSEDGSRLYMFGGYHNGRCFNDLFCFHVSSRTWTRLECTGTVPTERVSHQGVVLGEEMYVFGGSNVPFGHSNSNELFVCDLARQTWKQPLCQGSIPTPRYGHTLVARKGSLYLFGGTSGCVYFSDLYRLDIATYTWTQLDDLVNQSAPTGIRPSPRYRHEAVATEDRMYVIGGGAPNPTQRPVDVHSFDFRTNTWQLHTCLPDPSVVENGGYPTARRSHTCVLHQGRIVMYGGTDGGQMFDDMWSLDLKDLAWAKIPLSPRASSARCFHASTVSPQGVLYVFGGCSDSNGNVRSNDISCVHLSLPSLRDIAAVSLGASQLYSAKDLHSIGLPPDLVALVSPCRMVHGNYIDVDMGLDVYASEASYAIEAWTPE